MRGRNLKALTELAKVVPKPPEVSRLAQLVAFAFFPLGRPSKSVFHTPSRLTPDALKGLEELEAAGLITSSCEGSLTYCGTEKLPMPRLVWSAVTDEEIKGVQFFL